MERGKLITLEGPDCSGKSSNMAALAEHLVKRGYKVVMTREPGGTELGDRIRSLLLNEHMASKTELLLFAAQRAEHMAKRIMPALELGYIVISDRFFDSTYAYQGTGRDLVKEVLLLEQFVLDGFEPDYTLFFDVPNEEASRRLNLRQGKQDRLDKETEQFRSRVFQGYQDRFIANPHRMHRIDALPEFAQVSSQVIAWANSVFENKA